MSKVEADSTVRGEAVDALGYRLRRAQISVFQRFLATFEALQLRPAEYSVLQLISDNPGSKQTAIAEILGIKRANFVTLIDALQNRGLVERRPSPEDRRANALHLTKDGAKFFTRARRIHDDLERQFTDQLGGPARRQELIGLLSLLT
jgi:DNA-binding MarR family transcriptional regulator